MLKFKFNKWYVLSFAAILITEILIAVYVRDNFIRPYAGDVLVVILIYCFIRIFLPPYRFLPLGVFIFAAGVEFAQFFRLAEILGVQNNPVLSVALGSVFDLADIICYAIGGLAVYIWQRRNNIFMRRF